MGAAATDGKLRRRPPSKTWALCNRAPQIHGPTLQDGRLCRGRCVDPAACVGSNRTRSRRRPAGSSAPAPRRNAWREPPGLAAATPRRPEPPCARVRRLSRPPPTGRLRFRRAAAREESACSATRRLYAAWPGDHRRAAAVRLQMGPGAALTRTRRTRRRSTRPLGRQSTAHPGDAGRCAALGSARARAACRKNSTTPASCHSMRRAKRSISGGHELPATFRTVGSAPANHASSSPLALMARRSSARSHRIRDRARRASARERWQHQLTALMTSGGSPIFSE